jgi:chemotaxis signal transduction protein
MEQNIDTDTLDIEKSLSFGHFLTVFTFRKTREGASINIAGCKELLVAPKTVDCIRGVIHSDGEIIAVVDPKLYYGADETKIGPAACIVLVERQEKSGIRKIGILVDDIKDVFDIIDKEIEDSPIIDNSCCLMEILANIDNIAIPANLSAVSLCH